MTATVGPSSVGQQRSMSRRAAPHHHYLILLILTAKRVITAGWQRSLLTGTDCRMTGAELTDFLPVGEQCSFVIFQLIPVHI